MEEKHVVDIKNKKATFEYFLIDEYVAGLVLTGTEIKSIRDGKANLTDAYCTFIGNELFVRQMHVSEYRFGSYMNHPAKRDRKDNLPRLHFVPILSRLRFPKVDPIPSKDFDSPSPRRF